MQKDSEIKKNTKTSSNSETTGRVKKTKNNVALRTRIRAGIIGTISKFF